MESRDLGFGAIERMLNTSIVYGGEDAYNIAQCALAFDANIMKWKWQPYLHAMGRLLLGTF